ncbi:MAG TPA: hypothetical protein ENF73_03015, partial [Proteobacteria bacterium]|nr:hypothetical protein [Pseudomonadota bacterium]
MKPITRVFLLLLILAAVCAFFVSELKLRGLDIGFPIDAAWIHYVFARNLANGELFTFNRGVHVMGSTSPLWVFLLTPAFWISPSEGFRVWWGLILGLTLHLATAVILYLKFRRYGDPFAFLVAASLLSIGRLVWASLSGMETSLFCFLSVASWLAAVAVKSGRAKPLWLGLMLALTIYARPEGYLLSAVLLCWLALDTSE